MDQDDASDRRKMREESQYASGDHGKSPKSAGAKDRYKDKDDGRGKRDNISRGPRFDDKSKYSDRDRDRGSGSGRHDRDRDRGGDSRRERDQGRDAGGGRYVGSDRDRRSDRGDRERYSSKPSSSSKGGRYADEDKRGIRDDADKKRKVEGQQHQKLKENENEGNRKEQKEELSEEDKKKMEEEEKQKQEEERLRQEEERQRLEEETKRKAIEEEERRKAEEEKSLKDYIAECKTRIEDKNLARVKNLGASDKWPDDGFFSKLDSSLKKNTAFVKKLKNLTDSQKDSLCKEMMGLNLTKYIGEVASALVEAKLKMSDVPCAIYLSGVLHERYSEFSTSLLEVFNKNLLGKKDEKISNPSKYRVDLRFLGELVASGVFKSKEGLPILANQLSILVTTDREEHNYLPILTSFCKHCGDEYMGIIPRKYRLLSEKFGMEIPLSQLLPPDRQKGCRNLLKDYYTSLVKHLTKDHKALKQMEAQNRKTMQTKGEVSSERRELYETTFTAFQKLHTSTLVLADLLDEDVPDFPQEEYRDEESGMLDIYNPLKDAEFQYEGDKTLFEDEDTRTFYEHLPDLRAFIPGILYRDSEQSTGKDDLKNADTGLEEEMENLAVDDIEKELETEQIEESMREAERQEGGGEDDKEEERFVLPEIDEEDQDIGSLMKVQFESFISSLPTCVNRDLIDKAATEFCMNFNTKTNRKKLVKTLFTVHRTRYDLLPFYSRLVAILEPCMPELATDLVQLLKSDFKWLVRKKDQINIETKLKITRFIGELVKFKVCPKTEALQCLKILMFDFRHHNIEMACALLETCGRFLYRSSDSHYRTKIYLEVMMRKKTATRLDARYDTMIENAFYYSNPPEVQAAVIKERPPIHQYIRKLLYKDLSKATTEKVLRQMRKLPWDDPEIAFYATKCLTAVWNIRYNSIHCAANLLAGIGPYHEHVAIQVVDGVLEDIRLGMEVNHPRYNQRRVSCVKYLAELYNYRMFESSVIFKVLYSLITFGVSLDENNPSPLDRPEHLFRIRLVCVTLETCGQFFDEGLSKKRLNCFLVYFQRYYWFKKKNSVFNDQRPFPIDIDNFVHETLDFVRPKLKIAESYEDACKACETLEAEYRSKIANVLTIIETEETEEEEGEDEMEEEGLSTILEGEENEDDLTLSGGALEESGTQDSDGSSSDGEMGDGEGEGEEEEEGDSCTDDFTGSDEEDENEKEVKVLKPKHVTSKEDEDFMAALDQMMNENIKARTQEPLKVPQINISLPQQIKAKGKKPFGLLPGSIPDKSEEDNSGLHFILMTRKGNKQQLTDLEIPMSAEFATKFKEREEANRLEKERMKQMVLNLNERQEEEEFQEALATMSSIPPSNTNRERKVKYQHPKGAPDADLIFGNKKR